MYQVEPWEEQINQSTRTKYMMRYEHDSNVVSNFCLALPWEVQLTKQFVAGLWDDAHEIARIRNPTN